MKVNNEKFISLFLVISLMMISANLYAKERRGAILIITKKDGQLIEGELITVKKDSLLLFTGKDVSVDIADINIIKIVKKSKALSGAGIGGLAGALAGIGFAVFISAMGEEGWGLEFSEYFLCGAIGYGAGALVGALIGAASGTGKTIQIEDKSDSKIQKTLDKLRKKARIPDYK